MANGKESFWEKVAGVILAVVIGTVFAAVAFFELSK
jgi:hypothetical protein